MAVTGEFNNDSERIMVLRETVKLLPAANFSLARRVIGFCVKVAENSHLNKMTPSNLGKNC